MSELTMPNDEIVMRYRQAKDKSGQVKILAELNACPVERIIGILVASGEDNRKFNHLRGQLKKEEAAHSCTPNISQEDKQEIFEASLKQQREREQQAKIPYKKPEIIPEPLHTETKTVTLTEAIAIIKAEIAELNRQQYELDIRKAALYKQVWDMLGEVE